MNYSYNQYQSNKKNNNNFFKGKKLGNYNNNFYNDFENYESLYNFKSKKNENNDWEFLNRQIINYQFDLDSYKRDLNQLKILNCKSLKNFFDYFKKEYHFIIKNDKEREKEREKNNIKIFKELNEFMGWSEFYLNQIRFFHSLNDLEKEYYLIKFYKKYNILYDEKFSYKQSFDYISYTLRIKDKFEEYFMELGNLKKGIFIII
jgi:hypothetical protein